MKPVLPVVARSAAATPVQIADGKARLANAAGKEYIPVPSAPLQRPDDKRRRSSDGGQEGTLVGRAVDMVSSARGFLGAFWNAN